MQWHNQPPAWNELDKVITVTSAPKTDFWRKTHDGGIRDNGHFYYQPVSGDFTAEAKVTGQYHALYDHAGLMVRLDETTWVKFGVEMFNGAPLASVVVTRDYSDWSVIPSSPAPPAIWLRIIRHGVTLEFHYSLDGQQYTMLRQAALTEVEKLNVGIMCAAPTGEGFSATFEGFTVRP
jgi:regulation of enolase protein 1 (concanavalin A-like superfamily)